MLNAEKADAESLPDRAEPDVPFGEVIGPRMIREEVVSGDDSDSEEVSSLYSEWYLEVPVR